MRDELIDLQNEINQFARISNRKLKSRYAKRKIRPMLGYPNHSFSKFALILACIISPAIMITLSVLDRLSNLNIVYSFFSFIYSFVQHPLLLIILQWFCLVPFLYFGLENAIFFRKFGFGFGVVTRFSNEAAYPYEMLLFGKKVGGKKISHVTFNIKSPNVYLKPNILVGWMHWKNDSSVRALIYLETEKDSSLETFANNGYYKEILPKMTNSMKTFAESIVNYKRALFADFTKKNNFENIEETKSTIFSEENGQGIFLNNSKPINNDSVNMKRAREHMTMPSPIELLANPPLQELKKLPVIEVSKSKYAMPIDIENAHSRLKKLEEQTKNESNIKNQINNDPISELEKQIGIENVKKTIYQIYENIQLENKRISEGVKIPKQSRHFVFRGNPGTGKTTIARILAKIFFKWGITNRENVVEVTRKDFIGTNLNQILKNTEEILNSALGGVLFIDEAYTLLDSYEVGKQAIDLIMKRMENENLIVIVAGYRNEMLDFLESNPGLSGRFKYQIDFQDFSNLDLSVIFEKRVNDHNLILENNWLPKFFNIVDMAKKTYSTKKPFENARWVVNFFEKVFEAQGTRIKFGGDVKLIKTMDIENAWNSESRKVAHEENPLLELENMVGLFEVKKAINDLVIGIHAYKKRIAASVKDKGFEGHFVFLGNPGTGKTTVARLLGKILNELEILPGNVFNEVDRSNLVAGYIGQTAIKTTKEIEKSIGGVLFIDEAYSLNPNDNSQDFGKEAIDTLLKRMEDDRGRFVVVVAGYTDKMEDFIKSNPGLESRFTHFINFNDYSPNECLQIFKTIALSKQYKLEISSESLIVDFFERQINSKKQNGQTFSNGRSVRNFFQKVETYQGKRIVKNDDSEADIIIDIDVTEAISNLEAD